MSSFRKNNRGFSLIEVLVAVAIIAIAGTSLFIGFVHAGKIHSKTTNLQMAEDVAQKVAEEFTSTRLMDLKTIYEGTGAYNLIANTDYLATYQSYIQGASADDVADVVEMHSFKNLGYSFDVVSNANYLADVLLVARYTKSGEQVEVTNPDYIKTTYEQNQGQTLFYAIDPKKGTNTFIIPEMRNIYDGKSVVISDKINGYDDIVVNDLRFTLLNAISAKSDGSSDGKVNIGSFESGFSNIYVPLSNMTDKENLKKTTDIKIVSSSASAGVNIVSKYYYLVTVTYEFKFDVMLDYATPANPLEPQVSLKSYLTSDSLTPAAGSEYYTVDKVGEKYTVTYSQEIPSTDIPASALGIGEKATFWGEVSVPDGDAVLHDGSGGGVPYIYFIYKPLNIYVCELDGTSVYTNDVINISYSGTETNNVFNAFIVGQEMTYDKNPTKMVEVKDINIDYISSQLNYFNVYTNCDKAFKEPTTHLNSKNYLTNSYGKEKINHYELVVVVKDTEGNEVSRFSTVKED